MKFPFFKQLDSVDCGPSCLRMIAKFYGKSYTLQSIRSKSFITKSGVSMLGISDAAESIGFRTRGYRLAWEQLRDEIQRAERLGIMQVIQVCALCPEPRASSSEPCALRPEPYVSDSVRFCPVLSVFLLQSCPLYCRNLLSDFV